VCARQQEIFKKDEYVGQAVVRFVTEQVRSSSLLLSLPRSRFRRGLWLTMSFARAEPRGARPAGAPCRYWVARATRDGDRGAPSSSSSLHLLLDDADLVRLALCLARSTASSSATCGGPTTTGCASSGRRGRRTRSPTRLTSPERDGRARRRSAAGVGARRGVDVGVQVRIHRSVCADCALYRERARASCTASVMLPLRRLVELSLVLLLPRLLTRAHPPSTPPRDPPLLVPHPPAPLRPTALRTRQRPRHRSA